jgi:phosphoglycerol transferase MdoB-like AlkP superfamily enzyme
MRIGYFKAMGNRITGLTGLTFSSLLLLLFILLLMTFSRFCLLFFNPTIFGGIDVYSFLVIFFGGLRFDLSVLLMFNLPFLFLATLPFGFRNDGYYRFFLRFILIAVNSVMILPNYVDAIYYRYTMKRMTGDFLTYAKAEAGDITVLLPQYILDFWPVVLLWLFSIFLLVFISRRILRASPVNSGKFSFIKEAGLFLFIMLLAVVGIRGGFQLKPVNIITAGQYAEPRYVPLVYSSPFSMVKTLKMKGLEDKNYFTDDSVMQTLFNPLKNSGKEAADSTYIRNKDKNVVIIILESFSAEHIGAITRKTPAGPSLTPFLDSLISQSMSFQGISNSKRSIEALPAIIAGLPSLMNNDFITSPYAGDQINSLATVLKANGYSTAFYHGGNNGTMGFDAFCRMAGIENYYGRNEYRNDQDFDGKWGIWDEPFFQFFGHQLSKTKQPFFAGIFSLSSHHPYSIPEKYKQRFNKGKTPLENTIEYTDFALKQFFASAQMQAWYKNTLFVITADHTSESTEPLYQSRTGMYSIPIVFFEPGGNLKGISHEIVQQTDIMPSVISWLGITTPYVAFGNNVFDKITTRFAINYLGNAYCLYYRDHGLIFENGQSTALYRYIEDPLLKINLLKRTPQLQDTMEALLKAYVQQYNFSLINNKLIAR